MGLGLASVLQPRPLRKPSRFGGAALFCAVARLGQVAVARASKPAKPMRMASRVIGSPCRRRRSMNQTPQHPRPKFDGRQAPEGGPRSKRLSACKEYKPATEARLR